MDCDYTLITNVERVRSKNDPLIVNCTAVLLSNVKKGVCKGSSLRGFASDPAMPVFQMHLDANTAWPYKLDFVPPKIDPGWTCFGQYDLTFAFGGAFELWTLDAKRPIDVAEYSGDIYKVWADLREKVATYWDMPAMPVVDYVPPSFVLRLPNFYRSRIEEDR